MKRLSMIACTFFLSERQNDHKETYVHTLINESKNLLRLLFENESSSNSPWNNYKVNCMSTNEKDFHIVENSRDLEREVVQ